MPESVPAADLPVGVVRRAGPWTVAHPPSGPVAVSSRCRHQLADLSKGTIDAKGCLVCPWHGARYDLADGKMVAGPKGFLGYVGRTPGYTEVMKALARVLPLRRRRVERGGDVFVVR